MAKDVEFKNYTAKYRDSDGDRHTHTVSAHVVTKDSAGEYVTRTGNVTVKPGNVLVETDQSGVYDVHSAESWKETGYGTNAIVDVPTGGSDDDSGEGESE